MVERFIAISDHRIVLSKIVRWQHEPSEKVTVIWFDDGTVMTLADEPGVIDDALIAAFYDVTPAELLG